MAGQKYTLDSIVDQSGSWDWENAHVSQAYLDPDTGVEREAVSINDIVES